MIKKMKLKQKEKPRNFTPDEQQLLKTLDHLERKGNDAWGHVAQASLTAIGALAGGASAPLLWSALGYATTTIPATFLGSTTIASWLGIAGTVVTVATPVGWIAGGAVAVGGVALALSGVVRHAGRQDEIRKRMKLDIKTEIQKLRAKPSNSDEKTKMIGKTLLAAMYQDKIPSPVVARIISRVHEGAMSPEYALEIIRAAVSEGIKDYSVLLTPEEMNAQSRLKNLSEEAAIKELEKLAQQKTGIEKTDNNLSGHNWL